MPNTTAYLVLAAWPCVALVLFRRLPVERALIWTLLGGYLVLPPLANFDLPLLPPLNKVLIPNLMALAEKLAAVLKDEDGEKFVCFRFELDSDDDGEGSDVPDFVLERSKVAAANAQICKQNRIADIASERLRAPFREG